MIVVDGRDIAQVVFGVDIEIVLDGVVDAVEIDPKHYHRLHYHHHHHLPHSSGSADTIAVYLEISLHLILVQVLVVALSSPMCARDLLADWPD